MESCDPHRCDLVPGVTTGISSHAKLVVGEGVEPPGVRPHLGRGLPKCEQFFSDERTLIPGAGFGKGLPHDLISDFTGSERNLIRHPGCRRSLIHCFGHDNAKWFHVNVHDGIVRVVEKIGRYDYDYPLVPIYIFLNYHQADEGGPTYAGLVSSQREWLLLFADGLHISVHSNQTFVDSVVAKLTLAA